jgi:hypothetical protein
VLVMPEPIALMSPVMLFTTTLLAATVVEV